MRKAGSVLIVLLLAGLGAAMGQTLPKPLPEDNSAAVNQALADEQYPSAKVCGACHPTQYAQWSLSSHAYANLSPMFNRFEQKINDLSSGTVKYFCVRCHASVGTALAERRDISWGKRSGAAKEGITCVTCHRVGEAYGKNNGARRITPGDINMPLFGPFDTTGVLKAIGDARGFQIQVNPEDPDKPGWLRIHQQAVQSDVIVKSEFCITCHQVAVHPGIKLETVWEEYRASPAAKQGITCQDCHMGNSPGKVSGYARGPAALVNGKVVNPDRKLTDHSFSGPGYPISHPGLFPFSIVESPWGQDTWLKFDYRARWGSDEFEAKVAKDPGSYRFPPEWEKLADRKAAWLQVQANLDRWEERKQSRLQLLANGSRVDGPFFDSKLEAGKPLSFHYKVTNLNPGHNMPSGSLGAQPELWLNVALIDPDGKNIWESGYLDQVGDLADLQSQKVHDGAIAHDDQLFSLQSKFLTTNIKGTDREMYLPINLDFDQLPLIRPGSAPTSLLNHPPFVRLEKRSIPPLGSRLAKYKIPGKLLTKAGTYRLAVRMRGRSEPIYFMLFVGSTLDMQQAENEWITDSHYSVAEFVVR